MRDTSLKVPHGEGGKVIDVKTFRDAGDDLSPGVNELVRVYVAKKRKIAEGDSSRPPREQGRHRAHRPRGGHALPGGRFRTPVDVVLNPLGVPSRMNIGQVLETHLGWAAHHGVFAEDDERNGPTPVASSVFDGATPEQVDEALVAWTRQNPDSPIKFVVDEKRARSGRRHCSGKARAFNGRTGEPFDQKVTVGYMHILKLLHLVDDKIHARLDGPYSPASQQPLGGKAQFGGQRFGEMEVGARGLRRRLHPPGDADHQVRRGHGRAREGLRGDRQGREHRGAVDPRVLQGAPQGDAVAGARRQRHSRGGRGGRGAGGG